MATHETIRREKKNEQVVFYTKISNKTIEHLIRIVFSVTSFSEPIEQMSFVVQMTFALKFEYPKLLNP